MSKRSYYTKRNNKLHKAAKISLRIDVFDEKVASSDDLYAAYITSSMEKEKRFGLPLIGDFSDEYPDFISLVNRPNEYRKTEKTCLSWYCDDEHFDTMDGLYNAIIYKDAEMLKYYKNKYSDIRYFIGPDYTMNRNFDLSTILSQLNKEAVVMGWLKYELGAVVYPNLTYTIEEFFSVTMGNIYNGSNVAVSLKGACSKDEEIKLMKSAIKYLVDNIQPKALIVYTVSNDKKTNELLSYARENNIKIIIPNNTLLERNTGGESNG